MVPEEHLLARFFTASKHDRYVEMISTPKKRAKFLAELDHFKSLDPRFLVSIPPNKQDPAHIAKTLEQKGAPPRCWLTSSWKDLDGKQMPLLEALQKILGSGMGTFLTCIPGKLAFFEGEEMRERYILERRN